MIDPISQLVSTIKNGYLAKKEQVSLPYSKFKEKILTILEKEGFLKKVEIVGEKVEKRLVCTLGYKGKEPLLQDIKMISKPGLRIYQKAKDKDFSKRRVVTRILSTSKGIMTEKEARNKNLGGEVILEVT